MIDTKKLEDSSIAYVGSYSEYHKFDPVIDYKHGAMFGYECAGEEIQRLVQILEATADAIEQAADLTPEQRKEKAQDLRRELENHPGYKRKYKL